MPDTFYPDPNVETTSVDGLWEHGHATWATCRSDTTAATNTEDSGVSLRAYARSGYAIQRAVALFDTSSIPDSNTVTSATLSTYIKDHVSASSETLAITTSNPASNTGLVASDYDAAGKSRSALNSPTEGATRVAFSAFTDNAYYDFTLNATGLGWISKTGVSKFGFHEGPHDIDNSAPSEATNKVTFASADTAGTSSDPKLVVVSSSSVAYTLTASAGSFTLTGIAAILNSTRRITLAAGSFTLTGINSILFKGYTLVSSVGSYILSGSNTFFRYARLFTASVGQFTLTGQNISFTKALNLITSSASFVLSGKAIRILLNGLTIVWSRDSKNTASFTNQTKNTASFTQDTKNTSSWTNDTKS